MTQHVVYVGKEASVKFEASQDSKVIWFDVEGRRVPLSVQSAIRAWSKLGRAIDTASP